MTLFFSVVVKTL